MSDRVIESIQEIVSKMNKAERGLFHILCQTTGGAERDLQVTNCDRTSGNGFRHQIRGRITTSPMNLGIAEREHGGFTVTPTRNGNLLVQVPSYGLMENVTISHSYFSLELTISAFSAGAGKSVIWCDDLSIGHICKLILLSSSGIVEDLRTLQKLGLASLAFFYCDFRDDQKKDQRGLLSSLLVQLCEQSDAYSSILSDFYVAHGDGSQHPSDGDLVKCLKDMLKLPGQATIYIIIDALDECPI